MINKLASPLLLFGLFLLVFSCTETTPDSKEIPPEAAGMDLPFFIEKDSLHNPLKWQIAKAYQNASFPAVSGQPVEGRWQYAEGDPAQGLNAGADAIPQQGEPVELPHSLAGSGQVIWYVKKLDGLDGDYVHIEAEDGVQLYQDGRMLRPAFMNYYPIQAGESSTLAIRVFNHNQEGGLKKVSTITEQQYGQVQDNYLRELFIQKLIRQAIDFPRLNEGMTNQIVAAIQTGERAQIRKAERSFPSIIINPFLQKSGFVEYSIIYERSVMGATQLDWTNLKTQKPNRFLCENNNTLTCETRTDLFEAGAPYRIEISDNTASATFEMYAPPNQLEYSFSLWGAPEGHWSTFDKLVRNMSQTQDAFTIGLGDMVGYGASRQQWVSLFNCLEPVTLRTPLYMAAGEKEYQGFYHNLFSVPLAEYLKNANQNRTYYSWRSPYAAFIVLDPNKNFPHSIDPAQRQWLDREMASDNWQSAQWRFLIVHQPPYAAGSNGYSGNMAMRTLVEELAGPGKIDFVLSGHAHNFGRLSKNYGQQETTFLVTGGAGAPLQTPSGNQTQPMDKVLAEHHYLRFFMANGKVRVVTYNLEGDLIDDFERNK